MLQCYSMVKVNEEKVTVIEMSNMMSRWSMMASETRNANVSMRDFVQIPRRDSF